MYWRVALLILLTTSVPQAKAGGAAIKKAIEAVLYDIELDLQSETAERTRARV
jgi:hypothetical protein